MKSLKIIGIAFLVIIIILVIISIGFIIKSSIEINDTNDDMVNDTNDDSIINDTLIINDTDNPPINDSDDVPLVNDTDNTLEFMLGPGDYNFNLIHDDLERRYLVHVPNSYDKNPTSLIMNLHGGGGNAESARISSKMDETSNSKGFIVVYPEGTGTTILEKHVGSWNSGRGVTAAMENNIDDVGFIDKMLIDLQDKFNIDSKRIYSTGLSNGALMTYRLACERADKIAAIAPIAGHDAYDNCNPSRPVPIIHFHGTADPAAFYDGGQCGTFLGGEGWTCSSVQEYMDNWKTLNNCNNENTITYQNSNATCITNTCSQGSEITLCTIEGAGHTWPGGIYANDKPLWVNIVGSISNDINANEEMWEFFQKHSL